MDPKRVGLSVVCIRMDEAFLSFPGGKRGVLSMQFGRRGAINTGWLQDKEGFIGGSEVGLSSGQGLTRVDAWGNVHAHLS